MLEFLTLVTTNWPTVGLVATLLIGVYFIARHWNSAEMSDMRKRVDYLDERVETLLRRDQCYFAFVLMDAEWHHRNDLRAIEYGWIVEPHPSFLEFRDQWMVAEGLEKDLKIWKSVT